LSFYRTTTTILTLLCGFAFGADTAPTYVWKPNDVVRFEYYKRVEISENAPLDKKGQPAVPPDPLKRFFEFAAILIIEVNKGKSTGTEQLGVLRFDSPRIDIPDEYWFSPQLDEVTLTTDKDKAL